MTSIATQHRLGLILSWYSRSRLKKPSRTVRIATTPSTTTTTAATTTTTGRRSLHGSSSSSSSSSNDHNNHKMSPIYVAATRQHVGKTSTSMALLSGLQKRFDKVGFMKPVGQQSLQVAQENGELINIDKDAVLVKEHFHLDHVEYQHISPILIPKGYTRAYLDGHPQIHGQSHETMVQTAYRAIRSKSDIVLCEGTGHCAVGSIIHASNAQVASWLNAKMVLVANGGLGNTFDELNLNKVLCDKEGVEIAGVIVNKVQPNKLEQTREYIQKALDLHWGGGDAQQNVPLLGCIPDRPFLGCPALSDLEKLFGTTLLTGHPHRLRHYQVQDLNLVAASLPVFLKLLQTNPSRTLYVCHASRDDIILGFLMDHPDLAVASTMTGEAALIVTGTEDYPLSDDVLDMIQERAAGPSSSTLPPVLLVKHSTHKVMEMIHRYTPKLNFEDSHRANKAVEHYEQYIDFELLLERVGYNTTASSSASTLTGAALSTAVSAAVPAVVANVLLTTTAATTTEQELPPQVNMANMA
jgi:BioD-like phosphotransacetylase family protein